MEFVRNSDGGLAILAGDGRVLAEFAAVAATPDEFEALVSRISAQLGATLPRVAVVYREGLIEGVQADLACEVVLIEDDPFDDPPVTLRRRALEKGDAAAVDAVLAAAQARAGTAG